jgi:predicted phage terminase large subunit-like protein
LNEEALAALAKRFPTLAPEEQAQAMQMLTHLLEGKELIDCQEHFLPFVKKMWPGFVGGKHHKQLADAFEAIAKGELKRVCISIPPRSTKSEFASFLFPAWFLGKYPNKQILQTSHKGDLAVGFGRKVRNLVDSPAYNSIFPDVKLRGDSKAAGRWNTGNGGSYYATGVGAGLAGFGADLCVSGDTVLETDEGALTAREIVAGRGSTVLAFDHHKNKAVMARVVARGSRLEGDLIEIDVGGQILRCTHDHPIWVGSRGYVSASEVKVGDRVRKAREAMSMRDTLLLQGIRVEAPPSSGLLGEVPGDLHAKAVHAGGEDLRDVRQGLPGNPGAGLDGEVLCRDVQKHMAVRQNVGGKEPEVPARRGGDAILPGVRHDLQDCAGSGGGLLSLQLKEEPALPSHLPQEGGQPETESDYALRLLSQGSPQRAFVSSIETVTGVRKVRVDHGEEVFNVTVETHHNYFANGILTHNCIIDDPHDEQEAMHGAHDAEVFAKAFDWYQTGPRQRLQPGAAILVIHTRWSKQDLIGRLIQSMDEKEGADKWHIIEIPAINAQGESYWPEYWPTEELLATKANIPPVRWNAQYMQNPTGEEGALVKREWWRRLDRDKIPDRSDMEFVIQSWDTAHRKTQRSDFSVCSTWGVWRDSQDRANILLIDLWRDRVEFPELKKKAIELYNRWKPDSCIIEGKAAGDALIQEMRHMGIPIKSYTPSRGEDKMVRVNSVADLFASGMVWAPNKEFADEVIEEFADFPYGAHDDMVDSSTLALMRFRQGNFIRLDSDEEEDRDFDPGLRADYY